MKLWTITTEVMELPDKPTTVYNKVKGPAWTKVHRAIQRGQLTRPTICEEQSEECNGQIEACHYTYDRPLLVRWLCKLHHRRWDDKRRLKPGEEYAF